MSVPCIVDCHTGSDRYKTELRLLFHKHKVSWFYSTVVINHLTFYCYRLVLMKRPLTVQGPSLGHISSTMSDRSVDTYNKKKQFPVLLRRVNVGWSSTRNYYTHCVSKYGTLGCLNDHRTEKALTHWLHGRFKKCSIAARCFIIKLAPHHFLLFLWLFWRRK